MKIFSKLDMPWAKICAGWCLCWYSPSWLTLVEDLLAFGHIQLAKYFHNSIEFIYNVMAIFSKMISLKMAHEPELSGIGIGIKATDYVT